MEHDNQTTIHSPNMRVRNQAKNWCFTLNNPTDDEINEIEALGTELPFQIVYLVYGKETGESGTPHLQGYICFKRKRERSVVKDIVSPRTHLESAKGTPTQASEYCKKDGDFKEFGTLPQRQQGKRSDLATIARKINDGSTLRKISQEHPGSFMRYGGGITRYRHLHRSLQPRQPEIWVFHGVTGSGKTSRVWNFVDIDQLWVHPGGKWFDGFDDQSAVLLDDYDGSWFKISYLLKLLDRYPFPVPVKGGFVYWQPKTIYITSNLHPEEWYPHAIQRHRDALMRRLTQFGTIQECHVED